MLNNIARTAVAYRAIGASLIAFMGLTGSCVALGDTPDVASATAQPEGLQEIVVTAQHRSQSLEQVPISITEISPLTMEQVDMRTLNQVAIVTPGLIFDTANGLQEIYIRGIGSPTPVGVGLESPVAAYIDGAYLARQVGTTFDLMDVGSVEVLKGPQGTLYGHNASGGAILVNTADPTDTRSFSGAYETGQYGHTQFDAVLNLPISDTLALRVAGRFRNDGGFVYDIANGKWDRGEQSDDVRGKLKWTPSDNFTAVLTLEWSHLIDTAASAGRQDASGALCLACTPNSPNLSWYQVSNDYQGDNPGRSYSANLNLQYVANDLTFKSITAYRDLWDTDSTDNDYTAAPALVYDSEYGGKTYSEDLTVASSFGGIYDFLAGIQYIYDDAFADAYLYGTGFGLPYVDSQRPVNNITSIETALTRSYAGYVELYVKPIDRLTTTFGVRYTKDTRSIGSFENANAVQDLDPGGPSIFSEGSSDHAITPRFVVAYDAGIANLYASYNRGFKSGGFSLPSFAPSAPVEPETIDSYEIGAKVLSPDRRTRLNASAFLYNYRDAQVGILTGVDQLFKNAAAAQGKGIEIDVSRKATDWLTLAGGVSYLDARYTDYPNAAVYLLNAAGGVSIGQENLSGTPLPRAPEWSGYLSANLEAPLVGGWVGRLNTVVHYSSSYYFEPGAGGDLHTDMQTAYAVANLTAGVGPASGAYEIGIYADNFTGTRHYDVRDIQSTGIVAVVSPPAMYGVRLKFKF